MKIGFSGIELPEGNVKYVDPRVVALTEKEDPKKVTPYYVELIKDEYEKAEAIIIDQENTALLIIPDIEKFENRLTRTTDEAEKKILQECIKQLEDNKLLCDLKLSEEELKVLRILTLLSLKPVVIATPQEKANDLIKKALDKAGQTFFYTSGKSEVHAWPIKKGSDIVTCAGKIHKDLARGFIKGDVVAFDDYLNCHSFNDAKQKGLVKVVDRDYIVQEGEIVEIRFNV